LKKYHLLIFKKKPKIPEARLYLSENGIKKEGLAITGKANGKNWP